MTSTYALIPAAAAVLLSACAPSPFAPASQPISGTWSGRYEQLSCTTGHFDPRPCGHHRLGNVTLTLSEGGQGITGHVEFRSDDPAGSLIVGTVPEMGPMPISGTFQANQLSLQGTNTFEIFSTTSERRLHDWVTVLNDNRVFTGTTAWTVTVTTDSTTTVSKREYRLSGLRRVAR